MSTIEQKITEVNNSVVAIKQAVSDKGISMEGVVLSEFSQKISEITGGNINVEALKAIKLLLPFVNNLNDASIYDVQATNQGVTLGTNGATFSNSRMFFPSFSIDLTKGCTIEILANIKYNSAYQCLFSSHGTNKVTAEIEGNTLQLRRIDSAEKFTYDITQHIGKDAFYEFVFNERNVYVYINSVLAFNKPFPSVWDLVLNYFYIGKSSEGNYPLNATIGGVKITNKVLQPNEFTMTRPFELLPPDSQPNYSGYVIRYGNMALADIISNGYTPLTVKWRIAYSGSGKQTSWSKKATLTFNSYSGIDIGTINAYASAIDSYPSGNYAVNGSMDTIHTDLEIVCAGDLVKCKSFTGITGGDNVVVVKWLVPSGDIPEDGKLWLYKDGVVNEELTGGLTFANVTNQNGKLNFASGTSSYVHTVNSIPTNGMKIGVELINNYVGAGQYMSILEDASTYCISLSKHIQTISNRVTKILVEPTKSNVQIRIIDSYGDVGDCVTKIWLE